MSEELEQSLQQAIETYINDRLRSIDEQLSRLQTEFSEALMRLREQSAIQSLDGTNVSAAIFAHLQTARSERLTGAPAPAAAMPDAGNLKRAVQEIGSQQSQADVLKALLRAAVDFADRVALFVIKNDQAIGWRLAKIDDPDLEMIGGVSLPLAAQTIVTRAARNHLTAIGADAADSDYAMLLDQLGGAPAAVAALPLIVRGKVVAVLYADSPSSDANAMKLDALELLTSVAAMAVNLVSIQRAVNQASPAEAATAPAPAQEVEEETYTPQIEPVAEEPSQTAEAPAHATETVEAETAAKDVSVAAPETEVAAPAKPWQQSTVSQEPWPASPEPKSDIVSDQVWSSESSPAVQESEPPPQTEAEATTQPLTPVAETAPDTSSQYSTPLGSSRRYGVTEPELPIEVTEDERRLHNDARRFARLLVSEIKLYNEPKVQEGRSKGDLYDRLRDDIDRSRQMYDKRVAPPVAARHDYFHQELVNTLAEGDVAKLGHSYPGDVASKN
ncbi:MAG TPA: GAF domain-containing protein [Pyrinomonadaceae bacterium]|nr:GAF domain-containing protein [Pyrinomonadaceae bacterium]